MPLLEIEQLGVDFECREGLAKRRTLRALDGVSLSLERGESLGLVGESGCGKTTLGRSVLGLVRPSSGRVVLDGMNVNDLRGEERGRLRKTVQMIFQDPFGSLNPRLTAGSAMREVLRIHGVAPVSARYTRAAELMKAVGLEPRYMSRYPHEFSGGQRQRICIARALAANPVLIVADEPVSALDVSVQAQILNLMKDLQVRMNLSYLFIAHDLAVVRYMCRRVMVMYLGRIVESAETDELFARPSHPYTEALLSAVPDVEKGLRAGQKERRRVAVKGDVPSVAEHGVGCAFRSRCPRAAQICAVETPQQVTVSPGHASACHFARIAG